MALTGSATLVSPLSGATATAHVGFNNGSGDCSGNDPYAFCVDTGLGYLLTSGGSQTFVVSFSGPFTLTDLSIWHLQTLVTDGVCHAGKNDTGCTGSNDKNTKTLVAISTLGTVTRTPPPPTPEPASLALLGAGILGLGGLVRRKK
ncbi:MAG: PEP-CTERM sorting domain-containing protein [Terriglobales bacterium]